MGMDRSRRLGASGATAALLAMAVACGGDDSDAAASGDGQEAGTLVMYSGRDEELIADLVPDLEKAAGVDVEVRYGDSPEMAAQILEEGENTDADLFFSQDAGALGALAEKDVLTELPDETLDLVDERFRADDGTWVATSARARVIAYDPGQVDEADVPNSLDELVEPTWKGKVGYAPTNASWQAFVTAIRVLKGEDEAREWLTSFKNNDPQTFDGNSDIRDAVDKGDVALGLINHYYVFALIDEKGEDAVNVDLHYVGGDDPLGLVNVAGVGVLDGSDQSDAATKAAAFLLSEDAQRFFADETAEYPVVEGVSSTKHDLPELSGIESPDIDLTDLASLEQTQKLLQEVGLS